MPHSFLLQVLLFVVERGARLCFLHSIFIASVATVPSFPLLPLPSVGVVLRLEHLDSTHHLTLVTLAVLDAGGLHEVLQLGVLGA